MHGSFLAQIFGTDMKSALEPQNLLYGLDVSLLSGDVKWRVQKCVCIREQLLSFICLQDYL